MIRGNSQFGKSFQKLFVHKQQMFEDNDNMLIEAEQLMDFYQLQPARVNCKICDSSIDSLGAKIYHGKSKIEYSQCARCGHLNGLHQDTNLYMNTIYREAGGAAYGQNYKPLAQSDFDSRVNDIYLPKAQYLFDTAPIIKDPGVFLDIGCGTGHFASALTSMGLKSVTGIDVSSTQISSARKLVAGADFGVVEPDAIGDFMDSVQPRFVSLVGVLEHLQDRQHDVVDVAETRGFPFFGMMKPSGPVDGDVAPAVVEPYCSADGPSGVELAVAIETGEQGAVLARCEAGSGLLHGAGERFVVGGVGGGVVVVGFGKRGSRRRGGS